MSQEEEEYIVIALGGSIIVSEGINFEFLKEFRELVLKLLKENKKFLVVAGGGSIARDYQNAASKIVEMSDEDKDWVGIHATRLNAQLLRAIFFDFAHPVVLDDPFKVVNKIDNYRLFISSGWKPGWSTDYVAALLTKRFKASRLIIATKIPYVYSDDIEKNPKAKPLEKISWKEYRNMVGDVWVPGMKSPVDPVAAKFAEENSMEVIVAKGTDLVNLEKIIRDNKFEGTTIT
jgi:uridylate kinase